LRRLRHVRIKLRCREYEGIDRAPRDKLDRCFRGLQRAPDRVTGLSACGPLPRFTIDLKLSEAVYKFHVQIERADSFGVAFTRSKRATHQQGNRQINSYARLNTGK
jgi:hypothetical protein